MAVPPQAGATTTSELRRTQRSIRPRLDLNGRPRNSGVRFCGAHLGGPRRRWPASRPDLPHRRRFGGRLDDHRRSQFEGRLGDAQRRNPASTYAAGHRGWVRRPPRETGLEIHNLHPGAGSLGSFEASPAEHNDTTRFHATGKKVAGGKGRVRYHPAREDVKPGEWVPGLARTGKDREAVMPERHQAVERNGPAAPHEPPTRTPCCGAVACVLACLWRAFRPGIETSWYPCNTRAVR